MNTILEKQEVAQGVKLGSFKEFEALNSNELKGIEGGILWAAVFFMITTGIYLYDRRSEFIEGFKKGYNE